MKTYDNDTLKRLQECELSILKDFIKICEENGFTYFGFAGTGIGALRHGGFIPWDDDIDVAIPRKDHDKLIEIIKTDYSDKYIVVDANTYKDYPLATTRICIKNSRFVEETLKKCTAPLGIFLDVYPLDNAASNERAFKRQACTAWFFSKLLILKHIPFPVVPFRGIKRKLVHCITAVVWFFLNLFCIPHKFLCNLMWKASCKYNDTPSDKIGFFCSTRAFVVTYTKEDIYPLRPIKFEDIDINFPNALEENLTVIFGDYMQLPPPEKRKNHFPFVLKFPGEEAELRNE